MNVFPTIYNTLSGWMSRYPFSSKSTSTKHTVHSWGHSSTDSSCSSQGDYSRSTDASQLDDLILGQVSNAWQDTQSRPQPQQQQPHHHQRNSKPTTSPSQAPSASSCVADELLMEEPWRSHHIFVESQTALVAAQRRFFLSVVRATHAHLDGLVDQDEVAMFGHLYPDARARINQGFSGQNHLRLDEWDRSLERARQQFGLELRAMAQRMQYLHVDAMRELIGDDEGDDRVIAARLASSSTSLPTPATSPEPSRKRSLDDSDEKITNDKAANTSRPRPLKRARIETVKTEDHDLVVPPVSIPSSVSLSAAAEALMASSSSSSLVTPPPQPTPISPKRTSQASATRRRRRITRLTRSGTKKSH